MARLARQTGRTPMKQIKRSTIFRLLTEIKVLSLKYRTGASRKSQSGTCVQLTFRAFNGCHHSTRKA